MYGTRLPLALCAALLYTPALAVDPGKAGLAGLLPASTVSVPTAQVEGPPPPFPHSPKWTNGVHDCDSDPAYHSNLNSNIQPFIRMDDFVCTLTGNIVRAEFIVASFDGSSECEILPNLAGVDISIFEWTQDNQCGYVRGALLCQNYVPLEQIEVEPLCESSLGQKYAFRVNLPDPCPQQRGEQYVIQIAGVLVDPDGCPFTWSNTNFALLARGYGLDRDTGRICILPFDHFFELFTEADPCGNCPCASDVNRDGVVDFGDILNILRDWGECPVGIGSCCFDDGTCRDFPEATCSIAGGVFLGEGTACEGPCAVGACCLPDGSCTEGSDARCAEEGGVFMGDGTLCEGPCNNDCEDAIEVGEGSYGYTTMGASTDGPALPPDCDEGSGLLFRNDVWFRYTASCNGVATASVCESSFDTRLAVYGGAECPGPFIACNDNACGEGGTRSEVAFPVESGRAYLIRIGARFATGEGTLVIDCAE